MPDALFKKLIKSDKYNFVTPDVAEPIVDKKKENNRGSQMKPLKKLWTCARV